MSNTNENQEKKEGIYFIKQFVRGNTNNKGSIVQLSISRKTGDMLITIAPQKGMNGNLPIFDYEKKMIFNLTEEEIIKTMALFKTGKEGEVSFPHLNGKNPKIIISKIVSTKMIRNFIESDEEIQVIGFLDETNERYKFY